jgi:SAM-dependent methyltransferase
MKYFTCPLCGGKKYEYSWLVLEFQNREFKYLECSDCRSLICDPMPDEETLSVMYDSGYCDSSEAAGEDTSIEKFDQVFGFLETLQKGNLIDYGCGDGKFLKAAKDRGWKVLGIEYNPDFAKDLAKDNIKIISPFEKAEEQADVLHLGDVLEHLTDLNLQFPEILDLLKDGGYLISHGPLEANRNLFYKSLKFAKKFKRNKITYMAPFHVTLATTEGQMRLFERFGLEQIEFSVDEVAFPAPESISVTELRNMRTTGLYALRKLSRLTSSLNMKKSGNRYFYAGKK